MAAKKKSTGRSRKDESEGRLAGILESVGGTLGAIGDRTRVARRVVAGLVIVALGTAWILGVGPLEQRVAAIQSDPIRVEFHWPTAGPTRQTWVPPPVRADLTQIVLATASMDPFDVSTLQRSHDLLGATGWFTEVGGVHRLPEGVVSVDAHWRTPAAVVSRDGKEYLVGVDTAVMRLPRGAPAPDGMFRVISPLADAPHDPDTGRIVYGRPWHFDDVKHAISLLEMVARLPQADAIVAVDLAEYPRSGRLSLITDTGCHLVWGAPLDEPTPGEISAERKMAHLGTILDPARRLDRGQSRIQIFTEHVFIDRTPSGGSG